MVAKKVKARDLNRAERSKNEIIKLVSNGTSQIASDIEITRSKFAELLLQRASIDLIDELDGPYLNSIIDLVASHLKTINISNSQPFDAVTNSINFKTQNFGSFTHWSIISKDRPFIVSSILEWARLNNINVSAMLHPIIEIGETAASINYLITEKLDQEKIAKLTRSLSELLNLLALATDDFTAMKGVLSEVSATLTNSKDPNILESAQFLEWITKERFNLFALLDLNGKENTQETRLGLFRSELESVQKLNTETEEDIKKSFQDSKDTIRVVPLSAYSPIHRNVPFVSILTRSTTKSGQERVTVAVGFFTSRALADECHEIPILRQKFKEISKKEGLVESTHDYKSSAQIIDSLPREDSLHLSISELSKIISAVLDVATTSESAVTVWSDSESRGASILLVIAQEAFDSWIKIKLENTLSKYAGVEVKLHSQHLMISNRGVVRLHGRLPGTRYSNEQLVEIQSECLTLARSWLSSLEDGLANRFDRNSARKLARRYRTAFSDDYRELQEISDAINDIAYIEEIADEHPFAVGCFNLESETAGNMATLVVYSRDQSLTISRALPVLENCGFEVLDHRSWSITPSNSPTIFSNRFTVRTRSKNPILMERFTGCVTPGIIHSLATGRDNDILNSLYLEAGLSLRAVNVLRTYCRLLWQVKRFASRFSIYRSLAKQPNLAAMLWQIFKVKFDPTLNLKIEERRSQLETLSAELVTGLREITDVNSDRIFRSLLSLLTHTVRTNVYRNWSTIALKINSQQVDIMPPPRPLYEIFVCSATVEGVHLRSGAVARGGLRWSDRHDDYRSEVLGLVKTQRIKNALIVPTGAKGGFILRQTPSDPNEVPANVERCYSEYIRALLSLTDTIKDGKVVRPPSVISYEGDDPYLVVAADKGTATFSDTANNIACDEFQFWLGDAFASGGSQGYDHKKYGITARGAWECVVRHARDRGKDPEREPFSAVGIGDMAGDVFGNGLLLSRYYKLLAAFNHKHIFIDPNPDPELSFNERNRLFKLSRSQWSDYGSELISKGGAIYGRFDKEINLSQEARNALGISDEVPSVMDGETLITHILKAPVDLIWNGGIGTYFKASTQSHAEVNDGSNDGVRINANEIRATIIGEGGNLGMTQLARIEYAQLGGGVNTDAIDNSAGVDLSDHEVNLKILFSGLLRNGSVSVNERNGILKEVAEDVCQLVLHHNRSHALLLTIGSARSRHEMRSFSSIIQDLSQLGYINRALENLPDDEKMRERVKNGLGLMRPELAICVAAAKLWVKDIFARSSYNKDRALQPLLTEYFPAKINQGFTEAVISHPLADNILASQIANTIIDGMGVTALHRICRENSAEPSIGLLCALAAEAIIGSRNIRSFLINNEVRIGTKITTSLASSLMLALGELTSFFIKNFRGEESVDKIIEPYLKTWRCLIESSEGSSIVDEQTSQSARLQDLGIPKEMANTLTMLPDVITYFELIRSADISKVEMKPTLQAYRVISDELQIKSLIDFGSSYESKSRWEQDLISTTLSEIRSLVGELTIKVVSALSSTEDAKAVLRSKIPVEQWQSSVEDLKASQNDVAALAVTTKNLRNFLSRL